MCSRSGAGRGRADWAAGIRKDLEAWRQYLREMPADAIGEALIELRGIGDCVESVFAEAVGRFDRTQQYAADGALSCVAWLRENCRLSAGAASERLAIARQLPELPATNEAFQRGDIGFQHAALIARTANQVGAEAVRPSEPVLLERAAEFDPDRFSVLTRHVRHIVDPDGTLSEANRAYNGAIFT